MHSLGIWKSALAGIHDVLSVIYFPYPLLWTNSWTRRLSDWVFSIRSRVVNTFFGLWGPAGAMFHRSEIWLCTLSSTKSSRAQPGTKVQEESRGWQAQCGQSPEWLKSHLPMNCWFSWMPQPRRNPNDVCEYNHLTQPTDTDGDSGTLAKSIQEADGDEIKWYQLTHSEHRAGS